MNKVFISFSISKEKNKKDLGQKSLFLFLFFFVYIFIKISLKPKVKSLKKCYINFQLDLLDLFCNFLSLTATMQRYLKPYNHNFII